eukprot:scaffold8432_cov66-Phaeocystis_antarctica.AAC.1
MSTGGITSSRSQRVARARASAHVCDVGQRGPFLAPPRASRTPSSWTEASRPVRAAAPRAGVPRPPEPARVGRSYARGKLLCEVLMQARGAGAQACGSSGGIGVRATGTCGCAWLGTDVAEVLRG